MATELELRERQKNHLATLLKLKKLNESKSVIGLQDALIDAIVGMDEEDVAIVEKIIGVKVIS